MPDSNGHALIPLERLQHDLLVQTDPCATCGQPGALLLRTRREVVKSISPLQIPGRGLAGKVEGVMELVVIHSRCLVCGRYRQLKKGADNQVVEVQTMEQWLGPFLGETKTTV